MFLFIEKHNGTVVTKKVEVGYKLVGFRINGFLIESKEEFGKLCQNPKWLFSNLLPAFKAQPQKLVDIVCTYQHNHSDHH